MWQIVVEAVFGCHFTMEIVVVVVGWTVDATGATVGMGWIESAYTVDFGVGSGLGGGGGDEVLD